MSLPLQKVEILYPARHRSAQKPDGFSDILVQQGDLSPNDLFKAQALQQHENLRLSELLQGLGFASEDTVIRAMSAQTSLQVIDLDTEPPGNFLEQIVPPTLGIRNNFVVWKQLDKILIVAISDPMDMEIVRSALSQITDQIRFVLAKRSAILRHYQRTHKKQLSDTANLRTPDYFSCRRWTGRLPRVVGAFGAALLVLGVYFAPLMMLWGALVWVLAALIGNGAFKATTLIMHLTQKSAVLPRVRPQKLPKISIMIPLLREEDIVKRLIQRMSKLAYPKELLEICLVYEANDPKTKAHLAAQKLPYWMRTIEVPKDGLQTKPRAMNYALDFCTGELVGIYDAEDAPEPDQLFRVVETLSNAPPDVACAQCRLDYFNTNTNWISRCFTIEYAVLFRVILPQLDRLGLPLPLGGTSVFFKRQALETLGRWDAHNVTEDADLGIRLKRLGYRCICADATTYEEANYRAIPWIKQRSRWLKGFLQTWMTHMRHPIQLAQQLGFRGFLVFQILFLGTVTSFAAAPLVLPLWLLSIGVDLPGYERIATPFLNTMVYCFIFTEFLLVVLGFVALRARKTKQLSWFLPLMWLYWPLGSFAAYKAVFELFMRPNYWDKTEHGINDRDYQTELAHLTASKEATTQ